MAELEQHPLQAVLDGIAPYTAATLQLTEAVKNLTQKIEQLEEGNRILTNFCNELAVAAGLRADDSIPFAVKEEQSEADAFMLQNDKDAIHATIKAIVEAGKHKQLPAIFAKNEMVGKNPSELINQCQDWQKLRALLNDLIAIKPKNG